MTTTTPADLTSYTIAIAPYVAAHVAKGVDLDTAIDRGAEDYAAFLRSLLAPDGSGLSDRGTALARAIGPGLWEELRGELSDEDPPHVERPPPRRPPLPRLDCHPMPSPQRQPIADDRLPDPVRQLRAAVRAAMEAGDTLTAIARRAGLSMAAVDYPLGGPACRAIPSAATMAAVAAALGLRWSLEREEGGGERGAGGKSTKGAKKVLAGV